MKHIKLFFLTCCLFFAAASGVRAQSIDYIDTDGSAKTATAITSSTTALGNGWWYVPKNTTVTITGRITTGTNVRLILEDGCNFTVNGGIQVEGRWNDMLTIYGQSSGSGKLTVQSVAKDNAGIGGSGHNHSGGIITITGGSVTGNVSPQPTNGYNDTPVYAYALALYGVSTVTQLTAGSINGISCDNTPDAAVGVYGIKDVQTDAGKVYFYLPATGNGGTDPETIRLTVGGNNYQRLNALV